ncbi:MAG: hypothetical protein LM590_01070 [Thermofilum sp.]|nr:hypothetical protein [Thermofilum sp.]
MDDSRHRRPSEVLTRSAEEAFSHAMSMLDEPDFNVVEIDSTHKAVMVIKLRVPHAGKVFFASLYDFLDERLFLQAIDPKRHHTIYYVRVSDVFRSPHLPPPERRFFVASREELASKLHNTLVELFKGTEDEKWGIRVVGRKCFEVGLRAR